jgi:hypothetical protein
MPGQRHDFSSSGANPRNAPYGAPDANATVDSDFRNVIFCNNICCSADTFAFGKD